MNSVISLTHLRPLLANPFLKRTTNVRPVLQRTFFSQNVAKMPRTLCLGQRMESCIIPKRYYNQWTSKLVDSKSHTDHGHMWVMERLLAIGSFTSFLAIFMYPCENAELFFVFLMSSHLHFGLEAIMVDYLRPAVVGNVLPKCIPFLAVACSGGVLVLLAWVAIYGNGIAGSLQQLWYLDPLIEPYDPEDSKLHRELE